MAPVSRQRRSRLSDRRRRRRARRAGGVRPASADAVTVVLCDANRHVRSASRATRCASARPSARHSVGAGRAAQASRDASSACSTRCSRPASSGDDARARRRRRRRERCLRFRGGDLHARRGVRARRHVAGRDGGRGDRRQDRRQLAGRKEPRRRLRRPGRRVLRRRGAADAAAARRCAKVWPRSSRRAIIEGGELFDALEELVAASARALAVGGDRRAGGQGQDGDRRRRPAGSGIARDAQPRSHVRARDRARVELYGVRTARRSPSACARRDCWRCEPAASASREHLRVLTLLALLGLPLQTSLDAGRDLRGDAQATRRRAAGSCVSCCRGRSATWSTASSATPQRARGARAAAQRPPRDSSRCASLTCSRPSVRRASTCRSPTTPATLDARRRRRRARAARQSRGPRLRRVAGARDRRRRANRSSPCSSVSTSRAPSTRPGLHLARFVAERYICTLGEALGAVVLAGRGSARCAIRSSRSPRAAGRPQRFRRFRRDWCGLIWDELPDGFDARAAAAPSRGAAQRRPRGAAASRRTRWCAAARCGASAGSSSRARANTACGCSSPATRRSRARRRGAGCVRARAARRRARRGAAGGIQQRGHRARRSNGAAVRERLERAGVGRSRGAPRRRERADADRASRPRALRADRARRSTRAGSPTCCSTA